MKKPKENKPVLKADKNTSKKNLALVEKERNAEAFEEERSMDIGWYRSHCE